MKGTTQILRFLRLGAQLVRANPERFQDMSYPKSRLVLLDLPQDVILEILEIATLPSILSFSRVSKACRCIAATVLSSYKHITLKSCEDILADVLLGRVKFLRIHSSLFEDTGSSVGWDITTLADVNAILGKFTNLRQVRMSGKAASPSWLHMDTLMKMLGPNLQILVLKMSPAFGARELISNPMPVFHCVRALHLAVRFWPNNELVGALLPNICARFPQLVHLYICFSLHPPWTLPPFDAYAAGDDNQSQADNLVLPNLATFHVVAPYRPSWAYQIDSRQLRGHLAFLRLHARRLEEFSLPVGLFGNPRDGESFDFITESSPHCAMQRLRYIRISYSFLRHIEHGLLSDRLEEIFIDSTVITGPEPAPLPPNTKPLSHVRTLTLRHVADDFDIKWLRNSAKVVAREFPALEYMGFDFRGFESVVPASPIKKEVKVVLRSLASQIDSLRWISIQGKKKCPEPHGIEVHEKRYRVVRQRSKIALEREPFVAAENHWDRRGLDAWGIPVQR